MNPPCLEKMRARSKRLEEGMVMELYHQTNTDVYRSLETASHGKMLRGDFFNKSGMAGGGIYFGHTPRECTWKALAGGVEKVTLKCRVKLGKPMEAGEKYAPSSDEMFKHLVTHSAGPFDSVILDRAAKGGKPPKYPVPEPPVHGSRIEDLQKGEK